MSLFEDLHLLICLITLIYLFGKIKSATQSRVLGITVSAFVVFFIFFQHVWLAFLFFFIMFGYMFIGGITGGIMEGYMTQAYMGFLGGGMGAQGKGGQGGPNIAPIVPMNMPVPGSGTGSWFK